MNHLTPTRCDIARSCTGTIPVPAPEKSCAAPRYVTGDRAQVDEIQALREASPLRLLLIHAVITTLLAVTAVEIGLLR